MSSRELRPASRTRERSGGRGSRLARARCSCPAPHLNVSVLHRARAAPGNVPERQHGVAAAHAHLPHPVREGVHRPPELAKAELVRRRLLIAGARGAGGRQHHRVVEGRGRHLGVEHPAERRRGPPPRPRPGRRRRRRRRCRGRGRQVRRRGAPERPHHHRRRGRPERGDERHRALRRRLRRRLVACSRARGWT